MFIKKSPEPVHNCDHDQLTRGMVSAFKLTNTYYGKQIQRLISQQPIHEHFQVPTTDILINKNVASIKRSLAARLPSTTHAEAIDLLNRESQRLGIEVSSNDKKGQLTTFTPQQSIDLQELIYELALAQHLSSVDHRISFDIRQALYDLKIFLLSRTTIEHGFDNVEYHAVVRRLLKTKPDSYFASGYLCDLFSSVPESLLHGARRVAFHPQWMTIDAVPVHCNAVGTKQLLKDRAVHHMLATS